MNHSAGRALLTGTIALLVGFALQQMGPVGAPVLRGVGHVQRLVFRVLAMIMWAAPIGAFGAILLGAGTFLVHRQIERRIDQIGKL